MSISTILQSVNEIPLGQKLDWLQDIRRAGSARFGNLGLPSPKLEDWKYTNILDLDEAGYRPAQESDGAASVDVLPSIFEAGSPGARLVFVNGCVRHDLSTPDSLPYGVTLETISEVASRDSAFLENHLGQIAQDENRSLLALNNAAMNSGYVLHVSENVIIDTPIEVIFLGGLSEQSLASNLRNLIILEEGARADIVVHYIGVGEAAYFNNTVNEISLGDKSQLQIYNVLDDGIAATNLAASYVNVSREAFYNQFNFTIGAKMSRHETLVSLLGENANCALDGVYLMRDKAHCDNTLRIDHLVPNTTSDVMFKGVLDDHSRGVFQGKIIVHRDAQHSDGKMHNKTMLMSDTAEIDTKPELEIYADDVKCAHGAASGHVDEMALFYMQSRGIPEARARQLLIQSFLAQAIDRVANDFIREAFNNKVIDWMPGVSTASDLGVS